MASSRPPPSKSADLDLTIVSAKHLKNVNWKNGVLKPYVVFWVDPDRRLATKSDDSGSTKPIWNERFTLPLPPSYPPLHDTFLTLEVFHSRPSDTPNPLVGSLKIPLKDIDETSDPTRIRKFTLSRPSGRPHGKIHLKLGLLGRTPLPPPPPSQTIPDYPNPTPNPNNSNSPMFCYVPNPAARDYRGFSPSPSPSSPPFTAYGSASYGGSYSDLYSGYYPGYSGAVPPYPSRPFIDRPVGYAGPSGPSAPLDYSSSYEHKPKGGGGGVGKMGLGAGVAVGAVAGALGGLALEEGMKYEEDKITERVENSSMATRDDYDYRGDY
ncbi:hypothetical protein HN51_050001 [Arachis hypogaea]|uniref:C2 domain-containing protein n=1 Tax=Arachis hypogaea TaxID=3818 RepID=A0A444YD63_ARAHY|nr:protein SRC2 homolog [Arachis ipaensis]XP_025665931.1 protein SRC2 homolog [Arachis hypogaea]RYQ99861.1 hypothetical protein Ahy_B07g087871 [Arachis hypogaea]